MNDPTTPCPVCKAAMIERHDVLDGWCICEESVACPNKCYFYEFTYGSYAVWVGDIEVHWDYTHSREYARKKQEEINALVEAAKLKLTENLSSSVEDC